MKIIWRVSPAPTGRYRSFQKRDWPTGFEDNADTGRVIARLYCDSDYIPHNIHTGNHAEIVVCVAQYKSNAFMWRKLKRSAVTLHEAKDMVKEFFIRNPSFLKRTLNNDY